VQLQISEKTEFIMEQNMQQSIIQIG
jgi:hypothetical protein